MPLPKGFRVLRLLCLVLFIVSSGDLVAQGISGYVLNTDNEPVPFVNIYVRELDIGTTTDPQGRYSLRMPEGVYEIIYSYVGYKTRTIEIIVKDKMIVKNIWLELNTTKLREITVRAGKKDPAYEIIRLAIKNKEKYISQVKSSKTKVYVRAGETMDERKKQNEEIQEDEDLDILNAEGPPIDLNEEARLKEESRLQNINLLEMNLVLNYQYPDSYKEERTGYKLYGSNSGLFIPIFSQTDFNFYQNLVYMKGISETPVISPLSQTAILSYKYNLEESLEEESGVVYKIRVTPRKKGASTCKGYVFINDSIWNINRLELTLQKGGLKFYDEFEINQLYREVDQNLWIPTFQEFIYETKAGKKVIQGSTVIVYSDFQNDYPFPPKFFGNEVAITLKEAYEKDSSYWSRIRPEPLTPDQQKMVAYRDSVERAHNNKQYLDSLEAKYNKITLGEILYNNVGFRNDSTKTNISISSLLNTVGFEVVGGWRLGPYLSYSRYYKNGKVLWTSTRINLGLKNKDLQGGASLFLRYDPYHLGDVWIGFGRSFSSVNSYDAYLNQLRISNYIVHNYLNGFHSREYFNGFYLSTTLGFSDRQPISGYNATTIINEVIEPGEALEFEGYQAWISNIKISYTPEQKFMSEPNRKVVLGSKYPTVSFTHKKGWKGIAGSDIDFDYVELALEQKLLVGILGNSRFNVKVGKFLNSRDLRYIDLKRFRQSDPYLYSDPLNSFQLLDTALSTTDVFLEGHFIHHFNGALINNIPLVKKLRIYTVAGGGFMWVKDIRYRHEEIFGGLERIFKLGARRRLRIGAYGVLAQSNSALPKVDWKVSFDLIDTWRREWRY